MGHRHGSPVDTRAGGELPARFLPAARRRGAVVAWTVVGALAAWSVGLAQSPAVNVSGTAGSSTSPVIARAGDGRTMVVWEEGDDLWYALWSAGAWSTAAPVPAARGSEPSVAAAPEGGFDLVWSGFSALDANFEIYHSRWADGLWSLPVNLSESTGQSLEPDIATRPDRGRLVVWSEVDDAGEVSIYGATSPASGAWASAPVPDAAGTSPRVAAGDAEALWHLVWAASLDSTSPPEVLYMARRTLGGWTLPEIISNAAEGAVDAPDIAVDSSGRPVIAWRQGGASLVLARLDGDMVRWTSIEADAPEVGAAAIAAAADGTAWLAYARGTALLAASVPAAGSGVTRDALATFGGGAFGAAVASDGVVVQVAVEGRLAGDPGEIYVLAPALSAPTATATATANGPEPTATFTPPPTSATPPPRSPTPPGASPTVPSASPTPTATRGAPFLVRLLLPLAYTGRR